MLKKNQRPEKRQNGVVESYQNRSQKKLHGKNMRPGRDRTVGQTL
jgi:hypothetical protein